MRFVVEEKSLNGINIAEWKDGEKGLPKQYSC